ncbi:MAG: SCO1664 family protein [Actinobacteria bacterium]|nr:SCO1664 family protein [Actinomycetota bacterium]
MPWSSNATFLAAISDDAGEALVIYKPRRGERPLWDFPPGSLCEREMAAFAVSEAMGWAIVPPTVLRDGPLGPGMVQLFIDHDPDDHYLELRDAHADRFREFAAFDAVINNADRKSGHCVKDARGHVWGIDHGVSFHADHKLRTVIWDYAGEPLSAAVTDGLCRLARELEGPVGNRLAGLLAPGEVEAAGARLRRLLDSGSFPLPRGDYPYPWPLV